MDGYVALGREGRRAVAVNAAKHPAKARMAESWRRRRDGHSTPGANGCRRRPTGGSRRPSVSAGSACAA